MRITDAEFESLKERSLRLSPMMAHYEPLDPECEHRLALWPITDLTLRYACLTCLGAHRYPLDASVAGMSMDDVNRLAVEQVNGTYAGEIAPERQWDLPALDPILPVPIDESVSDDPRPRRWENLQWDCHCTVIDHPHAPSDHQRETA